MTHLQLLTLQQLAQLLARSPETIRKDLTRNPTAVPPRVRIPGARLLRWRLHDVEEWLARHSVASSAQERPQ
jgi:predicted DNA-binding transcriptional regulator AlpA